MIEGFKEGLLLLREGEKARLFIPYYIAYGPDKFGPFAAKSDLVFEVEILKGIHTSILALAKLKNVTIIFLEAYPSHMESNPIKIPKLLDYSNAYYLDITNTFNIDKCVQVSEDGTFDRYHLNPEGHKVVADLIYNKLMKTKAI